MRHVCPKTHPFCRNYVFGRRWGKCWTTKGRPSQRETMKIAEPLMCPKDETENKKEVHTAPGATDCPAGYVRASEMECQAACKGGAERFRFKTINWKFSYGCFYIGRPNAGRCFWNKNAEATKMHRWATGVCVRDPAFLATTTTK